MRGVEEEPQTQQYPVSSAVMRPRPRPTSAPQQETPPTDTPRPSLKPPTEPRRAPAANQTVEPFYNLPGMSNLPEGFDIGFFEEEDKK
jgi:hypothetical protein